MRGRETEKRIMLCICIKNEKKCDSASAKQRGLKDSETITTTLAFKTKQCKAMLEQKRGKCIENNKNKIELYRVYNKI